jgi:23S rRNA (uracil1939-C5)-methyltransferase
MPVAAYRSFKCKLVVDALAHEGLPNIPVADVVEIAPATRRRATFKIEKSNGETRLGFHAARSHTIVDMLECRVLSPALVGLVPKLRDMMASRLKEGEKSDLYVVEADNGIDVSISGLLPGPRATAWAADWAGKLGLIRVTAGSELLVEFAQPIVTFGRAQVRLPPRAFLQPTREGEAQLAGFVLSTLRGSHQVADFFCGLGTFALRVAEHAVVTAIDSDAVALAALTTAARATQKLKPVEALRRDLLRRPLGASELSRFDAVILDPPRAGAAQQCAELARAQTAAIVYVSCNPASFAHDARTLLAGGWRANRVVPVDQFTWSSHIELVASFSRE